MAVVGILRRLRGYLVTLGELEMLEWRIRHKVICERGVAECMRNYREWSEADPDWLSAAAQWASTWKMLDDDIRGLTK